MTASCILKLSPIVHLSSFKKSRKTGLLISVSTTSDVSFIFNKFFITDATLELDKLKIEYLGKIAFSAMQGTPLLVLMCDSGCKFIQLSLVKSISNEILVQKPCQFRLNFKDHSMSFACYSSIDYTEWMNALNACLENVIMSFNTSLYNIESSEVDQSHRSDEDKSDDDRDQENCGLVRIGSHLTFSS